MVNPDGVRNQVEGCVVQALGGALFKAVAFAGGRILNGTMERYRVPRFKDTPVVEVIVLDRRDLPSASAGETPMIAAAPSIGSAARPFGEVLAALPVTLRLSLVLFFCFGYASVAFDLVLSMEMRYSQAR